ncbi:hypothetical protein DFH08DRAFT_967729 [Mycena albidolilacea]|uniref:Uncharacterized protein n=1 Tax=Mycena albidolilacea TaxID=1033008 RepID=A0AAD6ZLE8_9AGAR|nr:hypothetical protein DFH08DRAFT_967729 [Mycena albidolilacea]
MRVVRGSPMVVACLYVVAIQLSLSCLLPVCGLTEVRSRVSLFSTHLLTRCAGFAQGHLAVLASVPSRFPLFVVNYRHMLLLSVHVTLSRRMSPLLP